jgi:hypothetical protein
MATPSYFTDRSHILIAAPTGSRTVYGGKTTLATWWADTHGRTTKDLVLFVNVKLDDAPEAFADAVATSVEEVAGAMRQGATYVCLSPTTSDWEELSRRVQSFVRELPDDLEKMVVLDEAAEMDEDAVLYLVRTAGNGHNCKTVLLQQNPGDLSTSVRGQCILTWVGPVAGNNEGVFRANDRGAHYTAIKEEHDPYEWSVLSGPAQEDRDHYDPVQEEYVV